MKNRKKSITLLEAAKSGVLSKADADFASGLIARHETASRNIASLPIPKRFSPPK